MVLMCWGLVNCYELLQLTVRVCTNNNYYYYLYILTNNYLYLLVNLLDDLIHS